MTRVPAAPREIAIVMLSALGDAVHVLPVVNALKRKWPSARITWVIQPVPHQLVAGHPAVDDFIVFHRRRGLRALNEYREVRRRLRGRHFDLVLDLQVYFKAGFITAMMNATTKLGFDRARARDLNWLFTNARIPPHATQHVQDQYFEFLEYLGVDPEPVEWRIELSESERAEQREFFAQFDRDVCGIVVGTSKPQKNWLPERYAELIDRLETRHGLRCVLLGGPTAVEEEAAARIQALARVKPLDARSNGVRRLVALLSGCRVVVSPDTGPLHIARALDVPVVGLYGGTNPKRYGPYRKYTDLIVDGYARYPGEDYPTSLKWRFDGMERVTVDAVEERVAYALATY